MVWLFALASVALTLTHAQDRRRLSGSIPTFTVGKPAVDPRTPNGEKFIADFGSIGDAVQAAPDTGAIIRIRPGIYRETVRVDKPGIQLRGDLTDPSQVLLIYARPAANACSPACSATLAVTADDFYAEGLTIANDFSEVNPGRTRTPAAALSLTGDRALLRNVRLLGEQDTLVTGSKKCLPGATCHTSRQYFANCSIEGATDLIAGSAQAAFDGCEIHALPHPGGGVIIAQSRQPGENPALVFARCRFTIDSAASKVSLAGPTRSPDADSPTLVFLQAEIAPRIESAAYAQFDTPISATASAAPRELTPQQAHPYEPAIFLKGHDGWEPAKIH